MNRVFRLILKEQPDTHITIMAISADYFKIFRKSGIENVYIRI